jgi:hypothetical protein
MIFVFAVALFMFFVMFMLSLGHEKVVDTVGQASHTQLGKFASLR